MQDLILLCIFGYLCGSITFGKLLGNAMGIDIQKEGSGNIGFANAVRVLGWRSGVLVLLGDILKGALPTLFAVNLIGPDAALLVGCAAILGHVFPVWLKFKGGKAVATGLGVMLVLFPVGASIFIVSYCLVFSIFKKSDIASIFSVLVVALAAGAISPKFALPCAIFALIVLVTHRENIKKYYQRLYDTNF